LAASASSSGVSDFELEAFAQGGEGCLDLIKSRMVAKREETVDVRLRYPDPAREFGLLQT